MSQNVHDAYWAEQARTLVSWRKPFTQVSDVSFHHPVKIRWFADGALNVSENCLDRHLATHANKTAIIFEPDNPNESVQTWSYQKLFDETCRVANYLKSQNVQKGDRVIIYMPMIPEAVVAMLACARIGAVHCVVFGGFSAESLADRMKDCQSTVVITADEGLRGGKHIALKSQVDEALKIYRGNRFTIMFQRTGRPIGLNKTDVLWQDVIPQQSARCEPTEVNAEDPLFILYTSGSTNKPKGVLHTSGGYLTYAAYTFLNVFDYRPGEIFWCTADVGWITGHSYVTYGPLACGATTLLFEGVPNYPDASRFWQVIEKHKVNIFYTAPTAIRALMREGDQWVSKHSRQSLRLLGSVGEPINPEAWNWYHRVVGEGRCAIVDTWWQTETGGILISPLAKNPIQKPGSATKPLPGIEPVLVDQNGQELTGPAEGNLCLKTSWPGQMRTVYGDHARFESTYFSTYPGMYFTGDGCRRDADGDYWITGRVDDVLNVSGHRIGTAEVESALVAHKAVAEAAVVGCPHEIKGQGIYAFVILKQGSVPSPQLLEELRDTVKTQIGPIAKPDYIQFSPGLPKTRSGKIMRRILRKIVEKEEGNIGDTSTLADPSVVAELIKQRVI
jgi:acetyl-CoA synthetase